MSDLRKVLLTFIQDNTIQKPIYSGEIPPEYVSFCRKCDRPLGEHSESCIVKLAEKELGNVCSSRSSR